MHREFRPRRLARVALTVGLAAAAFILAACNTYQPNSIFHSRTDTNRDVGFLFDILIWLGSIVFVLVEAILIYTLIRFRRRGTPRQPEHVHGNTTLEIAWTIIPAVILVVIAIPTVRTIFRTQAKARADALQVEVIGHQWWWEFRYPQYTAPGANGRVDTVVTANELYLPIGRMVNFTLKSQDVIHSFWIPSLSGKRDVVTNHTNYLWFTPDSSTTAAFNGFCAEYCGASHANMRFRAFAVTPDEFQSWVAHQQTSAAFTIPATGQPAANTAAPVQTPASTAAPTQTPVVAQAGFIAFPREQMPDYAVPHTPLPDIAFNEQLQGDPGRGAELLMKGQGACLGCHTIRGNPSMIGQIGPNLTHIASRMTIAGGTYPNDRKHLARWIKNARKMKPGVLMPTIGINEYDPVLGTTLKAGLTDQQIADIVAYLEALK